MEPSTPKNGARPPLLTRIKLFVFGPAQDLADTSVLHRIALIPILAWIGLGADGLSSSSYGPEEAFRTLGGHTYLALALMVLIATTIIVISLGYSKIIERFPQGGGGYIVAGALLGKRAGVVSGAALVVDYVLTISVSIACAGDTLFSMLPPDYLVYKFAAEVAAILLLVMLNLRGVKESVTILAPIFILFVVTHVVLVLGYAIGHAGQAPQFARDVGEGYRQGLSTLGFWGMMMVLLRAFSLGGGTFTGIEAVSNGLPVMRAPRVQTAKRTMFYMALSLLFTATGLILCYLLGGIGPVEGKTMNAVLVGRFVGSVPLGGLFVLLTLVSEGALLFVAAQAGFIDGPRVMANMAIDYWLPRRLAHLSDRLTARNGILLMGGAALLTLFYTGGDVRHLVVMYSLNVFLTFSLSMLGMLRYWVRQRGRDPHWARHVALFAVGFLLCATVLVVTVLVKFREGGYVTVGVTGMLVLMCLLINSHYASMRDALGNLFRLLETMEIGKVGDDAPFDPSRPTAVVFVAGYNGLGLHTVLNIFRQFPGEFKNLVFVSIGVFDSAALREESPMNVLRARNDDTLNRYLDLARSLGVAAVARQAVGTDLVAESERICAEVAAEFPLATFFAGKLVAKQKRWYHGLLHNDFALTIQKRLQDMGKVLVIIPAKV